jgi:PelA/Pel-15E family pectate lyase
MKPLATLVLVLAVAAGAGGCQGLATAPAKPAAVPAATKGAAAVALNIDYAGVRFPWRAVLAQPPAWYASDEAVGLALNVIRFQTASGGWPKDLEFTRRPEQVDRGTDPGHVLSTIDNGATTTQLTLLAKILSVRDEPYLRAAFYRGFDYLLAAQYPNGGWPQYYPLRPGYYTHITFNDDAMIHVMTMLRDASEGRAPYAFVDAAHRAQAAAAVQKGIACILRCQIVVNGQPTVWCAQHNENTFAPAPARAYELASFSGQESVGITRFLMEQPDPSPQVIASIRGAVAWFRQAALHGIRLQTVAGNRVVVADPNAPPLWARFYDLDTGKPFFCGRDGIKKDNLADIEAERRNGYSWYGSSPAQLLNVDYPAWENRLAQPPTATAP